jgi:hypothetical protein
MKAPTRDPGDFGVAYGTRLGTSRESEESAYPETFPPYDLLRVFRSRFVDGIVRISGALDLDVPLNGRATGEE